MKPKSKGGLSELLIHCVHLNSLCSAADSKLLVSSEISNFCAVSLN